MEGTDEMGKCPIVDEGEVHQCLNATQSFDLAHISGWVLLHSRPILSDLQDASR